MKDMNLVVAHSIEKGGVYAPKTLMRRHLNRHGRQYFKPVVDHTESGILKDEPDNAHRRLQQGFEALRPAFESLHRIGKALNHICLPGQRQMDFQASLPRHFFGS